MTPTERMTKQGILLPAPPPKGGLYTPCKLFGNTLAYLSGCGPDLPKEPFQKGRLGAELSLEAGLEAARRCVYNLIAVLQAEIGDLGRVVSAAKLLVFVASAEGFYEQPKVANGASQALMDIFGEAIGCPARSAIGVNVLPGNIPVEAELLLELRAGV